MTDPTSLATASIGANAESRSSSSARLVRRRFVGAFHAEPVPLSRKTTLAQALAFVATSCLRQIALNESGVLSGSPEAVHQMRIGLRRLRAALSIFKGLFRSGEVDALKRELVWLTEQLAAVRDYDVLIASTRSFEPTPKFYFDGNSELEEELHRRQQKALGIATRAVASARFERLICSATLDLALWADEERAGGGTVRRFARRVLARRTRRVLRELADFPRLRPCERHKLRIRLKKLRYGLEFFEAALPKPKGRRQHFGRELEALQDTLGRLTDIEVHRRLAQELVEDNVNEGRLGRRIAFAMGALTRNEQSETAALVAAVPKLRVRLAKRANSWH